MRVLRPETVTGIYQVRYPSHSFEVHHRFALPAASEQFEVPNTTQDLPNGDFCHSWPPMVCVLDIYRMSFVQCAGDWSSVDVMTSVSRTSTLPSICVL